MRLRIPLALAPVALLLGAPWAGGPAAASCAGPGLLDEEPLRPGSTVRIVGQRFAAASCDDVGETRVGPGCDDADDTDDPPPVAYQDVALTLVQGDRSYDLGTADAEANGDIAWEVVVPAGATPGRARLETAYGAFRVSVG